MGRHGVAQVAGLTTRLPNRGIIASRASSGTSDNGAWGLPGQNPDHMPPAAFGWPATVRVRSPGRRDSSRATSKVAPGPHSPA